MLRSLFIDFNSYFASVEQQLNPALRGRPVGVVPVMADTSCCIAASIEAKTFGVKTGTQVREARRLCPQIILVEANHAKYVQVHQQAVALVDQWVPVRQVLSIDEMECELTGRWRESARALQLGQQVQAALRRELGVCMRTSVGIAPNTLLAKLASDMHKPDGLTLIEPHEMVQRLAHLPVTALHGVGPRMAQRLARCGISRMGQLYAAPRDVLVTAWGGVAGADMYDKLRGQWYEPRATATRSLGHSHVLPPDMRHPQGAYAVLCRLVQKAAMRLRKQGYYASSMSVQVRCEYSAERGEDGERWAQVGQTQDSAFLLRALHTLWNSGLHLLPRPLSVGVQMHGLVPAALHTPDLFETATQQRGDVSNGAPGAGPSPRPERQRSRLLAAVDTLNLKHGKNAVMFASAYAGRDHAPMRIAFNRIPDLDSER